ncbi:sulfatase-like hydrolase/transferase [Henriciella sp.]|uniref:sulfatase-like hydrolase/transferase n=1 Tax=Henriciella sp. TaxID=1968823 RepID=UPI00181975F6|nr:sulfatase-like hydrolase/transferase [Henriciella sp.]HIG22153.1 arylsulfatase [Henriciella sp.]
MKTASYFLRPILAFFALSASLVAHAERPNFVVILVDDAALMDFQVYGGEAATPNIDLLAESGALFTQHRATPFCAPSRAMLLTGLDNHLAGFGTIAEVLPPEHRGQPGYMMALEPGVETIATKLRRSGYRTYMTGKWHLGHGEGELPVDHGFDHSFILDASGADNWEDKPYLPYYKEAPWFEDGEKVDLPDDFYSSTFLVRQMQDYLEADEARPEPFFAYVSFMAVHIPVQAPKSFTDNYLDTYREGWDGIREQRWRRAQELGLVREGAALAPQPATIPRWDDLSEDEQRIAAKSMAVNAGALEAMDAEIGNLIGYLKASGQYENTVFVVTSDNGPEAGDPWGTQLQFWFDLQGYSRDYDTLGERGSYVALGSGGASAMAGPSHLFKFHAGDGGLRVPLIMSGPGLPEAARIPAFTTMADVTPTLLKLAGAESDAPGTKPITGRSLLPLLNGEAGTVYGEDEAVGFSTSGQAALYRGRYKLVRNLPPHGDSVWRLFDMEDDPGETIDLSDEMPDLKADLMEAYRQYAERVGVLELPPGYQVEQQIAHNIREKLWEYYWHWFLLAGLTILIVLALLFIGARRLLWALRAR